VQKQFFDPPELTGSSIRHGVLAYTEEHLAKAITVADSPRSRVSASNPRPAPCVQRSVGVRERPDCHSACDVQRHSSAIGYLFPRKSGEAYALAHISQSIYDYSEKEEATSSASEAFPTIGGRLILLLTLKV
jgi:hypothetical protein